MRPIVKSKIVLLQIFITALLFTSYTSSTAISSMGSAVITESNGRPCFSIQPDSETKNGLPLDGIVVSEARSGKTNELPEELWHFMTTDPSRKMILLPSACIRYGEAPHNATQRTLKQLEFFKIYSVSVVARSENTNTVAYSGQFCLKSDINGRIIVQPISNDERGGNKRYEVCARPK